MGKKTGEPWSPTSAWNQALVEEAFVALITNVLLRPGTGRRGLCCMHFSKWQGLWRRRTKVTEQYWPQKFLPNNMLSMSDLDSDSKRWMKWNTAEIKCLWRMLTSIVTRRDMIRTDDIRQQVGIMLVSDQIKRQQVEWLGHARTTFPNTKQHWHLDTADVWDGLAEAIVTAL